MKMWMAVWSLAFVLAAGWAAAQAPDDPAERRGAEDPRQPRVIRRWGIRMGPDGEVIEMEPGEMGPFAFPVDGMGRGGPPTVFCITEAAPAARDALAEDLLVFGRLVEKEFVAEFARDHAGYGAMVQPWATGHIVRLYYLEGFGVLVDVRVQSPLAPAGEGEEAPDEARADRAPTPWEMARDEVRRGRAAPPDGPGPGMRHGDVVINGVPAVRPTYDAEKVERIKNALVRSMAQAVNIRGLRADESVAFAVKGGHEGDLPLALGGFGAGALPQAPATLMSIRARLEDIKAAGEDIAEDEAFRKKLQVHVTDWPRKGADGEP